MADEAPKKITDKPPTASPPKSQNHVVRLLARLDRILARLTIITSTPAGTDSLLRAVTYTLQFIVCGLNDILTKHMDKIVPAVLAISRLLPKKSRSGSGGGERKSSSGLSLLPSLTTIIPAFIQSVPRARAFSSLISDFRSFTRLWGLLGMYAWGKSLVRNPPNDPILFLSAWGQCLAYTAYQAFENRAYLSGKGIWSKREGKDILADWLWSSRMWMIGVALEFVRLARVRQLWKEDATVQEKQKRRVAWRRDLIANLANAPLTVHWSVAGGTLDDTQVGFFGMIGGLVSFIERWKMAGEKLGA
jgi:Peroxisomal biogenesis factor 11 (PEX11)